MINIAKDFPTLNSLENGKRLAYLDSGATSHKPVSVIEAVKNYYETSNANPHRGVYELSAKATAIHEKARSKLKTFINAPKEKEIIFTKGATEALNLIAYSYGMSFLKSGDEIIVYAAEHHANFVTWQRVAQVTGAIIKYVHPDSNGHFDLKEYEQKLSIKTKIVAVAEVSNVLGVRTPVEVITEMAHSVGAVVVLDCAQSIPHKKVDVKAMNVDFIAFSAHKMYGPMGIGALYGKEELLEKMPPFLYGGDMIAGVHESGSEYAGLPEKFEGGTQNIAGEAGLIAAMDYVENIGWDKIVEHEKLLMTRLLNGMKSLGFMEVYGDLRPEFKTGVVAFNVKDVHPHDTASILDMDGIAVRAGHHCAQPLMDHLQINSCCRASLGIYNTEQDIDQFLESLPRIRGVMGI